MISVMCLAMIVYFEARGEPFNGQVAVAQVAINRAPDVINEPDPDSTDPCKPYLKDKPRHKCTFSFYCDGLNELIDDEKAWRTARTVALLVSNGTIADDRTLDATHYHAKYVDPYWNSSLTMLTDIGNHIFYR